MATLHELATCQEEVRIYFSASRDVSLIPVFDKVRGQFHEILLLTTENHHIFMVVELVRPANSGGRRLRELNPCQEMVRIYFRASKGLSLVREFDQVQGQLSAILLLTTENHHICMVAELVRPVNSGGRRLCMLCTC